METIANWVKINLYTTGTYIVPLYITNTHTHTHGKLEILQFNLFEMVASSFTKIPFYEKSQAHIKIINVTEHRHYTIL